MAVRRWVPGWRWRVPRLGWRISSRWITGLRWIAGRWRRIPGLRRRIARLWWWIAWLRRRIARLRRRIARLRRRIARLWRIARLLRRRIVASLLRGCAAGWCAAPGAEGAARVQWCAAVGAAGCKRNTARVTESLAGGVIGAAPGAHYPLLHIISPLRTEAVYYNNNLEIMFNGFLDYIQRY
jgi:hypothetical protein